jgi:hypothetical protein
MKLSAALIAAFASHATLSEVVIPPRNSKAIVLENISATSDKAASVIAMLVGDVPGNLAADAAVSATTLSVSEAYAGTLAQNDRFYLYNMATRTGEVRTLSSKTGGTLTFGGSALAVAYPAATTRLFKLVSGGSIPLGAATKEIRLSPGFLTMAPVGRPLVVDVDSTSAGAINHLLARYVD